MSLIQLSIGDGVYRADASAALDVSIPLDFDGRQPNHFGAEAAAAEPLVAGAFIGDTRRGGSCNAERYTLTPHCNGTHTECVGHVTDERVAIRDLARDVLALAALVSVTPSPAAQTAERAAHEPGSDDVLITRAALTGALEALPTAHLQALIVRSLPNDEDKLQRRYEGESPAPYLTLDAAELLVELDIRHVLVDMPSLDRAHDEGRLSAHRVFWGMPADSRRVSDATRPHATITELIFVPDRVRDGLYVLNLQIPPFMSDAAPSRPLLYPLTE